MTVYSISAGPYLSLHHNIYLYIEPKRAEYEKHTLLFLVQYLCNDLYRKARKRYACGLYPAPRVGFEPTTLRLTAGCSTAELSRTIKSGNHLLSQAVASQVPSAVYVLTRCSEWIPVFPIDASSPEILQMLLTPSKLNIRNKEILSQRYSSCKDKPSTY